MYDLSCIDQLHVAIDAHENATRKHIQCPENATEPDDVNPDPFECAAAAARRNLVIENFDSSRVKNARYGNCFTFEKVCSDVYRRYMCMYKYCVQYV